MGHLFAYGAQVIWVPINILEGWNCPYHDVQSDKIIPTYVMCINSHITCFINSMHHANKNENGNQELSHYKEQ